jgi:uncharacterized protein (TIGR02001 family)
MKSLKLALCGAVALALVGGAASAADAPDVSFNVGVASNYVFRGITQTDDNAQVFGGVDVTSGKFYTGLWVSNVDFGNSTDGEFDIYAGYKPSVGPVALDLGVIYYGYANKPSGPDEAYWEAKVAGSLPVGKGSVGAAVYYSPEFFAETGKATYVEVKGSMPLMDKFSGSAALGYQKLEDVDIDDGDGGFISYDPSYTTWNVGVTYAFTDHVSLDVRYSDTDADKDFYGSLTDSRAYATLKATF